MYFSFALPASSYFPHRIAEPRIGTQQSLCTNGTSQSPTPNQDGYPSLTTTKMYDHMNNYYPQNYAENNHINMNHKDSNHQNPVCTYASITKVSTVKAQFVHNQVYP